MSSVDNLIAAVPPQAPPSPKRQHLRIGRRLPIEAALLLGFGGLVAIAVSLVLTLGIRSARENTNALLEARVASTISATVEQLLQHIAPAVSLMTGFRDVAAHGVLAPRSEEFQASLRVALAATPQVNSLTLYPPTGAAYRVDRDDPGKRHAVADGESRPSVAIDEVRWGEPQWNAARHRAELPINAGLPDRLGDVSVLVGTIALEDLSAFLAGLPAPIGQVPFILYGDQIVVAHPLLAKKPGQAGLTRVADLADPAVQGFRPKLAVTQTPQVQALPDGTNIIYSVLDGGTEQVWVVAAHYQGDLVATERARLALLRQVGIGVFIAALLLAALLGWLVSRPVRALALAAQAVQAQGPEAVINLPKTRLAELADAVEAFRSMQSGLRDRERIRDLFGRYVPRSVVEQLIGDQGMRGAAADRREVSVLFTDLAGWTELAESLTPEEATALLNDFLELMCGAVAEHSGIVVDFIGDSIFAVFGAPVRDDRHAANALACARALDRIAVGFAARQREAGKRFLGNRIGVHCGIATVGSFGARERLKYGAVGDVVNTGSRLEGANKFCGTRLLFSRAVLDRSGEDPHDLRPVGELVLAGRVEAIETFTFTDFPDPTRLNAWRETYVALREAPERGIRLLAAFADAYPDDRLAPIYRARIAEGKIGVRFSFSMK